MIKIEKTIPVEDESDQDEPEVKPEQMNTSESFKYKAQTPNCNQCGKSFSDAISKTSFCL